MSFLDRLLSWRASHAAKLAHIPLLIATHTTARGGSSATANRVLLTDEGGPVAADDAERRVLAIYSDGTVLVAGAAALNNANVASVLQRAAQYLSMRSPRVELMRPHIVTASEIKGAYGFAVRTSTDKAYGRAKDKLYHHLEMATRFRCTDVQITTTDDRADIRYLMNGDLTPVIEELTKEEADRVMSALFANGNTGDPIERPEKKQKVAITNPANLPHDLIGARVRFMPLANGRYAVIRLTYRDLPFKGEGIAPLQLAPEQIAMLQPIIGLQAGVVTIGSPTEHGKSATLNCIYDEIIRRNGGEFGRVNVIAADKPPEGLKPGIKHVVIDDEEDGVGETDFIENLLQLSPTCIKYGEAKRPGPESRVVFDVGNTGRQIATTIHCPDVMAIPSRWVELGVDPAIAFSHTRHVAWIAQRLLSVLCPRCAMPAHQVVRDSTDEIIRATYQQFADLLGHEEAQRLKMRNPNGCQYCKTGSVFTPGVVGRRLLLEIAHPTAEMMDALAKGDHTKCRQLHIDQVGRFTLRLQVLHALLAGTHGLDDYTKHLHHVEPLAIELGYWRSLGNTERSGH